MPLWRIKRQHFHIGVLGAKSSPLLDGDEVAIDAFDEGHFPVNGVRQCVDALGPSSMVCRVASVMRSAASSKV